MEQLRVEIAYATSKKQVIIPLMIDQGTSIVEAILQSQIGKFYPELNILGTEVILLPIGVFGKKIDPLTYELQAHDRIEIYRVLNKTPNQKRLDRLQRKV